MSVFYKCYKKTHEVNDPAAPVYRAVEVPRLSAEFNYIILVLCCGIEDQISDMEFWLTLESLHCYIVEEPFEKMPNGNIKYSVMMRANFLDQFVPVTVDPWILSGGIDLSKCG